MNSKQIKLLSQIKRLVRLGNRRFANERRDRDYLDDLKKLRITEDEAWEKYILYLKPSDYVIDYKPSYYSTPNTLVFKKLIKDNIAYIKLCVIEENGEKVLCLSFHIDHDRSDSYEM